jgi:hypothetical protein
MRRGLFAIGQLIPAREGITRIRVVMLDQTGAARTATVGAVGLVETDRLPYGRGSGGGAARVSERWALFSVFEPAPRTITRQYYDNRAFPVAGLH